MPGMSRVMAVSYTHLDVYKRQVWRTAFVAAGLFVAVFTGIAAGSLYQSKGDAANIVLMNDSSMENFALYNQIGNE